MLDAQAMRPPHAPDPPVQALTYCKLPGEAIKQLEAWCGYLTAEGRGPASGLERELSGVFEAVLTGVCSSQDTSTHAGYLLTALPGGLY